MTRARAMTLPRAFQAARAERKRRSMMGSKWGMHGRHQMMAQNSRLGRLWEGEGGTGTCPPIDSWEARAIAG